ncbi:MAG: DUF177 domain-containing protein [Bacteroidales bacterium]|nr:DUF177 domain-containing protein [Bacteroidales bacterium]
MNKNSELIIPIKGLSIGNHHYDFVISDSFFESFEPLNIREGKVDLLLELEKESSLMSFLFHFNGSVKLMCDRCLEDYDQPVEGNFRLIVKYGEEFQEISDEIIEIPFTEHRIDLSQYIYEYIQLMLPMKHVHPDDELGNSTCKSEMLEKLNELSKPATDPRWDALLKLKKK